MRKLIKIPLIIIISIILFFVIVITLNSIPTQEDESNSPISEDHTTKKEIPVSIGSTDIDENITDPDPTDPLEIKYKYKSCDDLRKIKSDLKKDIYSAINFKEDLKKATEYEKERNVASKVYDERCDISDYYENVSCNILKKEIEKLQSTIEWREKDYIDENKKEKEAAYNVYDERCSLVSYYENMDCGTIKKAINDLTLDIRGSIFTGDSYGLKDDRKEKEAASTAYDKKCNVSEQYQNMSCADLKNTVSKLQTDIRFAAASGESDIVKDYAKELNAASNIYNERC